MRVGRRRRRCRIFFFLVGIDRGFCVLEIWVSTVPRLCFVLRIFCVLSEELFGFVLGFGLYISLSMSEVMEAGTRLLSVLLLAEANCSAGFFGEVLFA